VGFLSASSPAAYWHALANAAKSKKPIEWSNVRAMTQDGRMRAVDGYSSVQTDILTARLLV
jgi:hypothetical protein